MAEVSGAEGVIGPERVTAKRKSSVIAEGGGARQSKTRLGRTFVPGLLAFSGYAMSLFLIAPPIAAADAEQTKQHEQTEQQETQLSEGKKLSEGRSSSDTLAAETDAVALEKAELRFARASDAELSEAFTQWDSLSQNERIALVRAFQKRQQRTRITPGKSLGYGNRNARFRAGGHRSEIERLGRDRAPFGTGYNQRFQPPSPRPVQQLPTGDDGGSSASDSPQNQDQNSPE